MKLPFIDLDGFVEKKPRKHKIHSHKLHRVKVYVPYVVHRYFKYKHKLFHFSSSAAFASALFEQEIKTTKVFSAYPYVRQEYMIHIRIKPEDMPRVLQLQEEWRHNHLRETAQRIFENVISSNGIPKY